jgi:two-component system chemotaxis response regulator CheB
MNPNVTSDATLLRVFVVRSSHEERTALVRLLETDARLEVVGSAPDWSPASRSAEGPKPDLIMLDLGPDRRALDVTRMIMREMPTPVVMVAPSSCDIQPALLAEALSAGALAVVRFPTGPADDDVRRHLLSTVKNLAGVKVVRQWGAPRPPDALDATVKTSAPGPRARTASVVAIGASTGGPIVLRDLLAALPASFPVPVLIVQHMAEGFVGSLVQWLAPQCQLRVQVARSGVRLDLPAVFFAPFGQHLTVVRGAIELSKGPLVSGQRPSATVLFRSVAEGYGADAVGILLTGMGDDGAVGLHEMQRAGAITIAQDEDSSIVFGMPGAAVRLGAVGHLLAPTAIATLLNELMSQAAGV